MFPWYNDYDRQQPLTKGVMVMTELHFDVDITDLPGTATERARIEAVMARIRAEQAAKIRQENEGTNAQSSDIVV